MRNYSQARADAPKSSHVWARYRDASIRLSPQVQDFLLALMCVIAFGEPRTNLRESIHRLPELFLEP